MAPRPYNTTYAELKKIRESVKWQLPNAIVDRSDADKGVYRLIVNDKHGTVLRDCTSVTEVWLVADAWLAYLGGC